jgi:hypothetical protein
MASSGTSFVRLRHSLTKEPNSRLRMVAAVFVFFPNFLEHPDGRMSRVTIGDCAKQIRNRVSLPPAVRNKGTSRFWLPASGLCGKAEFYGESLKKQGLDPVVAFAPPEESRHGKGSRGGFPLELSARKPDSHLKFVVRQSRFGAKDGAAHGRLGVVAARLDWAQLSPDGHNINVLTSEKLTDMGNAATFYSVCVEVELFRAKLGECK